MATEQTGGFIYDPVTGTPVDKATALNAQSRWLEIDEKATNAEQGSSAALATLGAVKQEAAQAKTAAQQSAAASSSSAAASNAAADTAERFGDDVELLKQMAEISPGSVTDAQTALLIQDQQSETHARLNAQTVELSGEITARVDVRNYGAVPGVSDNAAPALNAAADAARSANRPLFLPAGTFYIDSTVNFRYLNIASEADIIVRHTDAPGVIIGDHSSQRNARFIRMGQVKHAGTNLNMWDWPHPALRVIGLKGATVILGNCSLFELFADASVALDDSTAYNTFIPQRVNHMRLHGINGSGWINQNLFIGGSFNRITLSGTYAHNANRWIMPSVEGAGSIVDIQVGSANVIEDARTEGGTQIKFGTNAWMNLVSSLYAATPALLHNGFTITEDLGKGNVVTTRTAQAYHPHTVLSIDGSSNLLGAATDLPAINAHRPVPAVGKGKLLSPTNANFWLDTGLIPLETPRPASALNLTTNPVSRVGRFVLHSDAQMLRPTLNVYDKDGVRIPSTTQVSIEMYGGWTAHTNGHYNFGAAVNGAVIFITNPAVKYIQLQVATPAPAHLFEHITLTAYADIGGTDATVERIRQALRRPLQGSSQPTQGLSWPGTVVQGLSGSWRAVSRAETTLAQAASGTSATVASDAGITTGDVVGILQTDGTTHWTTLASKSGTALTLATPLPVGAAAGSSVGAMRWGTA